MSGLKSVAALLILIVTNAFVFGGIAWNRSGEATGTMVFDQCELNSFKGWAGRNGSVRYVSLYFESLMADEDRLEKLRGLHGDGKHLERRVYVVSKHGGPEWQNFVERRVRPNLYRGVESKLILVDGGSDPERLLEKYPETEGRAVLPGYIGTKQWIAGEPDRYYWFSSAGKIAIDSRYRGIVKDIRDARLKLERAANKSSLDYVSPPCSPTHRITVKWGKRFEPWISSMEAM
jgi:hypothetical protein